MNASGVYHTNNKGDTHNFKLIAHGTEPKIVRFMQKTTSYFYNTVGV
jgi:hypothetical protein